nr:chemotaxis protein CheB [Novosphingobium sp. ES2-1]
MGQTKRTATSAGHFDYLTSTVLPLYAEEGCRQIRCWSAACSTGAEASSVVFGMPKEAIARGAADRVLGLDSIAGEILRATAR